MTIEIFDSKILETKYITPSVKLLKLSVPKDFSFIPGQYLSLSVLINGKKIRKPYSIASKPNREDFIEFCINLIDKSLTTEFIKKLKRGDEVELFGPAGKFVIEGNNKRDLFFVSVGTGLTPFMSIIPEILENGFNNKIILLKGFRNEEGILHDKEFSKLIKKYNNFEFYNILSNPKNSNFKQKGYVQDFLKKYIPKNFKGDFYICGLKEMINSVKKELISLGISERRIFYEKYD